MSCHRCEFYKVAVKLAEIVAIGITPKPDFDPQSDKLIGYSAQATEACTGVGCTIEVLYELLYGLNSKGGPDYSDIITLINPVSLGSKVECKNSS